MRLRKGILKSEIESILLSAQSNAIRTSYIKAKIDKTQQNRKCTLYIDRDKTINHISKCSKLVRKDYKTGHDWLSKMIHWELYKKLKFDHTNKWYMYNLESIHENEMFEVLREFEMQTDHLISATWLDLVITIIIIMRTCRIMDFAALTDYRVKSK